MGKYTISYSRTVRTVPYENIKVSLQEEFDDQEVPKDWAFSEVRGKVEAWIGVELQTLGIKEGNQ